MEWYVKLPLVALGLVELAFRALIALALCVSIIGLIVLTDESSDAFANLLTPWCFTHIQDTERRQRKSDTVLNRRQQRSLEYMRQEQLILDKRRATLIDIQQLESGIGAAFRPLP